MSDESNQSAAEPHIRKKRRWSVSAVWILPLLAAVIGLSMAIHSWWQQGRTITIQFETSEGLTPNKTPIKYRNVTIGEVKSVSLSDDHSHVVATVSLDNNTEAFTRKDTKFWVVRPRISLGGVSGVDTLFSGDFIGANAGTSSKTQDHFTGLETPPAVTYGQDGKRFELSAETLGSLDIGSPVFYRDIEVGQVVSFSLNDAGNGVQFEIFVKAPYDAQVTQVSRFWNASGVQLDLGADGLSLNTESVASILMGGIAFGSAQHTDNAAAAEGSSQFELFDKRDEALAPPKGPPQSLTMQFQQSLRGLDVGASVEFLGVYVGSVTSVALDYNIEKNTFPLNVDVMIYPQMIGDAHQKILDDLGGQEGTNVNARLLKKFVDKGLRAQAKTGNLLTGKLYISMDFYPNAKKVDYDVSVQPLTVPTIPASLEKLQKQLEQITKKINGLPLESIGKNLDASLVSLSESLNSFHEGVVPDIARTLKKIRQTMDSAEKLLDKDAPERSQLRETLQSVDRMSRSMRELSDYLKRNPESLLKGRPKNSDYDAFK